MSSSPNADTTSSRKDAAVNDTFSPSIIGIYGVSGAGKSTLLSQLKTKLNEGQYRIIDGSDLLFPGSGHGKAANIRFFKELDPVAREAQGIKVIKNLQQKCRQERKHAIVAGHYVFWEKPDPERVWTQADAEVYTHIFYLDVGAEEIQRRRMKDQTRERPIMTIEQLQEWWDCEKEELRGTYYDQGIAFMTINDDTEVADLIDISAQQDEADGEAAALRKLVDWTARPETGEMDTVLVFEADKTLAPHDSGQMFYDVIGRPDALEKIFSSRLGYSAAAFRQAAMLYEEAVKREDWEEVCSAIARRIRIHPEMLDLLRLAADKETVGVIVVTCGLGSVWEKVLAKEGLHDSVLVIGSGRLSEKLIVTQEVKKNFVDSLQNEKNAIVWAFGDSQLDLPMLEQADQAIVAVCEEGIRSKSMDKELAKSITHNSLAARQLLAPSTVKPRLDGTLLPVVHAADIKSEVPLDKSLRVIHETNTSASRILKSATRSKDVQGIALQESHRQIGHQLAISFHPQATGLETYTITTVQNKPSTGHRIRNEARTIIISCMRGGDPLAQGVFSALPCATYIHANKPEDLENEKHVKAVREAKNILLCDFVINEGKTMVEMIDKIRGNLNRSARIVMVAGVVQADAVKEESKLVEGLRGCVGGLGKVSLVALRLSANSYKGAGATDTGSRLFNTTKAEGDAATKGGESGESS